MAEALRERAQRIYEKYGNVMLETEGMTKAGIERKATCRALFSKLLYLAGMCPGLHTATPAAASRLQLCALRHMLPNYCNEHHATQTA